MIHLEGNVIKISAFSLFTVKGGFRNWVFVKMETVKGIAGWGNASDWDAPFSITEAIRYLEPFLIGKVPFHCRETTGIAGGKEKALAMRRKKNSFYD